MSDIIYDAIRIGGAGQMEEQDYYEGVTDAVAGVILAALAQVEAEAATRRTNEHAEADVWDIAWKNGRWDGHERALQMRAAANRTLDNVHQATARIRKLLGLA